LNTIKFLLYFSEDIQKQISKGSNTLLIMNMLCIYLQRIGYI